jgi:hypothetical protein
MTYSPQHISVSIECPASEVYAFAANGANLPRWASGLSGGSITSAGNDWIADSPMGKIRIRFAERNGFGVLDHDVTLPSGETVYNPMRVFANGDGCEVVFTLYQRPGMSSEAVAEDAATVRRDLETLKALLERGTEG